MNIIYSMAKKQIEKGNYEQEDMRNKLDVYLYCDRITAEQYKELNELMTQQAEQEG